LNIISTSRFDTTRFLQSEKHVSSVCSSVQSPLRCSVRLPVRFSVRLPVGCQFSSLSVRSSWGLIRNCSIPVQSSSVRVPVWFSLMSVWLPAVLYGCQYGCQFSSLSVRSSWGLIRNCSIPVQSSSVRVSVWFGLMSVWLPFLVGLSSVSVWSQFGLSLVTVQSQFGFCSSSRF